MQSVSAQLLSESVSGKGGQGHRQRERETEREEGKQASSRAGQEDKAGRQGKERDGQADWKQRRRAAKRTGGQAIEERTEGQGHKKGVTEPSSKQDRQGQHKQHVQTPALRPTRGMPTRMVLHVCLGPSTPKPHPSLSLSLGLPISSHRVFQCSWQLSLNFFSSGASGAQLDTGTPNKNKPFAWL